MDDKIFKALADPVRRRIVELLAVRDMSAGDIASKFDITAPSISRHLSHLKSAGIITDKRIGQRIIYSFNPLPLQEILQWIYENLGNVWVKKQ